MAALLSSLTATAGAREAPPPFVEPTLAHPPDRSVDTSRPGRHLQVNFPPAASAGQARARYWLTGKEPLVMMVELGLGPSQETQPLDLHATLVVDGRQIAFLVDDGSKSRAVLDINLVPGQRLAYRLTVPAARIAAGAHAAALLVWDDRGFEFPGYSFTIVKDLASPAALTAVSLLPLDGPTTPGVSLQAAGTAGSPGQTADGGLRVGPERSLAMSARFHLPPDEGLNARVVALVDGRQVSFVSLGPSPRLALGIGSEGLLPLRLANLPRARAPGLSHLLVIFLVPDVAGPGARDAGAITGHLGPRVLGRARW